MAVIDLVLISFTCLIFGLCSCIGYYLIYTGLLHFIWRNKLILNGRDGTAKVSAKKTNTLQLDGSNQTFYSLSYAFSYENKRYEIQHRLPKAQYDKFKIHDTIYISFDPLNPSNSLPKMAFAYPKAKAIKNIIFGIFIVIFSVCACLGIIYLFGYRDIFVFILNLCIVLIGFPFLALFCRLTVCRNESAKQEMGPAPEPKWTQDFVELGVNTNTALTEQKDCDSDSDEDDVRTPLVGADKDEILEQKKANKNEIKQKAQWPPDNEENDKQKEDSDSDSDSDPDFAFVV